MTTKEQNEKLAYSLEELGDSHDAASIPRLVEGTKTLINTDRSGEYLGIVVGALARIPGGLADLESAISPPDYKKAVTALQAYARQLEDYVADGFGGFAPKLKDVKQALKKLGVAAGERTSEEQSGGILNWFKSLFGRGSGKRCQKCGKAITGHRMTVQFFDGDSGKQKQLCMDCMNKELGI